MSIKALALELYRCQQRVDALKKELAAAPLNRQDELREELRLATAELTQLRKMLEGAKTPSPFRSKPSTFKPR